MTKEEYKQEFIKFKDDEFDKKGRLEELAKEGKISRRCLNKVNDLLGDLVRETRMEPFRIFGESEILTLCYFEPRTLEELEGLPGFPKDGARVTKYGERIINVFNTRSRLTLVK